MRAIVCVAQKMVAGVDGCPLLLPALPKREGIATRTVGIKMNREPITQFGAPGMMNWSPSRATGLTQLERFLPNAGKAYASNRNFDLGPERRSNVSLLSPWLRHRLVLEEEVLHETLKRHSFAEAQKFVQEVFWRTYFKGWLEQRPQIWTRYRSDVDDLVRALDWDTSLCDRYEEATEGRTGIDCFDYWSKELISTGYLHNHTRMWFASIWVFTLRLPWQLGADFFLRHLLDGDPASNTLGWRWVAGLHTKGKTYMARASNIAKYTGGRFEPEGQLAVSAPALTEAYWGEPLPVPTPRSPEAEDAFVLLITEEDCVPELLPLPAKPRAAIGLTATDASSPLAVANRTSKFARSAVTDALARADERFAIPTAQSDEADWATHLFDWASRVNVKTIITAYPTVGPTAERLAVAQADFDAAGFRLVKLMRCYDRSAWPHATKGFFGLKDKIPSIVSRLGLGS